MLNYTVLHSQKQFKFWYGLVLILGVLLAVPAWATTIVEKTQRVYYSSDNPEFTVKLDANPSTGYQWEIIRIGHQQAELVDKSFQANSNLNRIGAPGKQIWVFRLTQPENPKKFTIHWRYARPWNTNDSAKELKLKIIPVRKDAPAA